MRVPKQFRQFSLATLLVLMTIAAAYWAHFGYVAKRKRVLQSLSGDWRFYRDGSPGSWTMRIKGDEATISAFLPVSCDVVFANWRSDQIDLVPRIGGKRLRYVLDRNKMFCIGQPPDSLAPSSKAFAWIRSDEP